MTSTLVPRAAELQVALGVLEAGAQTSQDSGPGNSPDPESRAFAEAYREALALQERAAGEPDIHRCASLRAACEAYQRASALAGHSHVATLYNHGVALSDLARLDRQAAAVAEAQAAAAGGGKPGAKRPTGSEALRPPPTPSPLLAAALDRYAAALRLDPTNPQALNNAGLVLQELAGSAGDPSEAQVLLGAAVARFREALRRRPDFHRAAYNAGTALYSLAAARRSGGTTAGTGSSAAAQQASMAAARAAFSSAALYVALAAALRHDEGVNEAYTRSLETVAPMLPLPSLRRGVAWLQADIGSAESNRLPRGTKPHTSPVEWVRGVLEIDARELRGSADEECPTFRLPAASIRGAHRCADPSLPPGEAVWMALRDAPLGRFLVFDDADEAESWIDALGTLAQLDVDGRRRLEGILHARGGAIAVPGVAGGTAQ